MASLESWSQSHVNSISHLAPMYHNVVAQTSQVNLLQQQQQQQQQQSNNQQQPMQSQQYYCYPTNLQGNYGQNQYGQPYQPEPYGPAQQQQQQIPRSGIGNVGQPIGQTAYNIPSIMQNQTHGYGSLPGHVLDQIRAYIGTPSPIFILPNNCPNPTPSATASTAAAAAAPQGVIAGPSMVHGCPGIGLNCPSAPLYCPPSSCYPYQMAMPIFNPFANHDNRNNIKDSNKNCGCCTKRISANSDVHNCVNCVTNVASNEHNCIVGNDDTICTKQNCPSAINLQALASQLLAIPGIIPCAATRLVLRKIAGSNITSTLEETVERAKRSLNALNQEQLLSETRHAQQVNALINLHMTANPPPNVIPILTTIQLKINLLKAHVETSINRRLTENQGTEGNGILDPVVLALKSNRELRDLLGTLRQKECDERVNLNFAPYQSQRIIAENRLSNVRNKISQVETEMNRRRDAIATTPTVAQQLSDPGWYGYSGDISNTSSFGQGLARSTQNYESPDPFQYQNRNPKRLFIKPHVGSPETTYVRSKKSSFVRPSRTRKNSDDDDNDDCDDNTKISIGNTNLDDQRCACEKSSDDDSNDDGKKKLGGKITVVKKDRRDSNANVGESRVDSGLSVVKLSRNVVIVIDNSREPMETNEVSDVIEKIVGYNAKNVEKGESDNNDFTNDRIFVETMTKNGAAESIATAKTTEKNKIFKWGWKKEKNVDQSGKNEMAEVRKHEKTNIEDNSEIAKPSKEIKRENLNYFVNADGPEPIRQQTVQMIAKIDYEPSVFRAFPNSVDEPPEKDEDVGETKFGGSFVEDSRKSSSTVSTVDSGRTTETVSLRVEESEEASPNVDVSGYPRNIVEVSPDQVLRRMENATEDEKISDESKRTNGKMSDDFRRIHRSGPSHHNASTEQPDGSTARREKSTPANEQTCPELDSISGAITTIGNHVASFGSIIGKIASMKLHRSAKSSQMLLIENSTRMPVDMNPRSNENDRTIDAEAEETSTKSRTKKDTIKWKYIKFADVKDESNDTKTVENPSISETRELTKIRRSIVEDKNRGGKYVLIDEPSEELRRELGEPYRTERSLVIRSRPKNRRSSSSSSTSEQTEPFTVVKAPKRRPENCVALHLATPTTSANRTVKNGDLKSSEKFWFRSEKPDEQDVHRNPSETTKSSTNYFVDDEKFATDDSSTSINDENFVKVYEYSKIPIIVNREKLEIDSEKKL